MLVLVPRLITVAAGLATAVVTARYLGPVGKGVLSLSMLLVGISFLLADIGLTKSLMYHVSKGEVDEPTALAMAVYGSLALGGLVAGVALVAEPILRPTLLEGMSHRVYVTSLASLPGVVFAQLWTTIKMARKQFSAAAGYQLAYAGVSLIAAILILVVVGGDIEALVTGITASVLALAMVVLVASVLRRGFSARVPRDLIGKTARYGVEAYGGSLSNYALLRFDMLILNAVSGNAIVGQYSVAVSMTESLWHIDNAMGRASMPDVVSKSKDDASSLVAASGRMMMLVGGALGLFMFVTAPWLVSLLFGEPFMAAVVPLRILIPGAIGLSVARLVFQYHQGQLGKPGKPSAVLAGSAVTGLLLYLVAVPRYGMIGASAASTLVYVGTLVVALAMFRRDTGISPLSVLVPGPADAARVAQLFRAREKRSEV